MAAAGIADIISATNKHPRIRIPTFMPNVPHHFERHATAWMRLKNLGSVSERSKLFLDGD
jgi:hypothetical protein